jgi:hypothetical protein
MRNWNILFAKIEAAQPKPGDERSLSTTGVTVPPKRRARIHDPHGGARRSIADHRDHIADLVRPAVKNIGYEQWGFIGRRRRLKSTRTIGRYCAGRGLWQQGRPRHHVRLCVPGDARADASADLLCAPHSQSDVDLARQPDWKVRDRRSGRRLWPGRVQDYRGHLMGDCQCAQDWASIV